mgnify:CR=1 FL=1
MHNPCAVIPVYNHEHALPVVVTALHQAGLPCVLVDDASSPGCAAVMDQLAKQANTYLVRLPITHFAARLDAQRFLKVNRSCIVNLDFVESMTPDESSQLVVRLRDGSRFTASREVSKQLRADAL